MSSFNVLILCALDRYAGGYPPVLSGLIEALINQYSLLPSPETPVEVYYTGSNLIHDESKKKCSAKLQTNFPELCGYKPGMFDIILLDNCPLTNNKSVMSLYLLDKIKYLLKPAGLFLLKNTGKPVHVIPHHPIPDNKTHTLQGDNLKAYITAVSNKGHIKIPFVTFKTLLSQKNLEYVNTVSGHTDMYVSGTNKAVDWVIFQKSLATRPIPESPSPQPSPVTARHSSARVSYSRPAPGSSSQEPDPAKINFIQLA